MIVILLFSGFVSVAVVCFVIIKMRQKKFQEWQYQTLPVSQRDIQVLDKVLEILSEKSNWEPSSDRICIQSVRQSLFCAIAFASQEVTGQYEHWGLVSQEVRKTIEEDFAERWSEHPIMDFNAHPDTSYNDILNVLEVTRKRLTNRSNNSP